ncbi:MAG: site-specific integrase [Actinomycetota bacterium]
MKWRVIDRDPTDAVHAPRPARFPAPVIAAEQARAVMAAFVAHSLEPAVALALGAGLRAGEVAGLRWSAVDLDTGILRVDGTLQRVRIEGKWCLEFGEPKTDRSRRVLDLPAWTVDVLRAHRKHQAERRLFLGEAWTDLDLVLERGDGSALDPCGLSDRFRRRLRDAGLPLVRFHDVRHAHATLLLADGYPLKAISERLGHSTIGITGDLYAHVTPALASEAVRRLDTIFGPAAGE